MRDIKRFLSIFYAWSGPSQIFYIYNFEKKIKLMMIIDLVHL